MQLNIKTIAIVLSTLLIGWAIGFFTQRNTISTKVVEHQHVHDESNSGTEWTCSMHPQIRQGEAGDCPICGMDLIQANEGSSNDPLVLEMTEAAVQLANIQTTKVGSKNAGEVKVLRFSGKIQADERRAVSQVAHIPGRIEKLYVSFTGETVKKGQKIADLYAPELITAQEELIQAGKMEAFNEGLLAAARKKLERWKINKETIQSIEESGNIQEVFTVYAEASGIVVDRKVAVGDHVMEGEILFNLMNLDKVWVLFDAYEEDLASVRVGDRIEFTTAAQPNRSFQTSIRFIDPVINPQTRVAALRAELNNTSGLLKPEMLVYGSLQKDLQATGSLMIPKSAVIWTGKQSVVYTKIPDQDIPSFEFKEIEIGDAFGDYYEVQSGLEPGEEIVTNGNFVIDAAAQLNNQASIMNRDVLIKGQEKVDILPDYTSTTPEDFKSQIADLVQQYIGIKDALVASDQAQAQIAAGLFMDQLSQVNMTLIEGEAHSYWMEQLNALQAHGSKIKSNPDLEAQRKQFDFLSQALIKSVKVFGIPEATFYVQHCPMAFNNTGADWLSKEEQVLNPYFGDAMLRCGFVEETITKDFKNQSGAPE